MDREVEADELGFIGHAQPNGRFDRKEYDAAHEAAVDERREDRKELNEELFADAGERRARHFARREERRQKRADDAAHAVHAEGVERIVVAELHLDDGYGKKARNSRDEPDRNAARGQDEAGGGRHGDESRHCA